MLNFNPAQYADFSEAFQAHIDQAMQEKIAASRTFGTAIIGPEGKQVERKAVSAGVLGKECTRAIAYEYHRFSKDAGREPEGAMLRIFRRGHENEKLMVEYLTTAGFQVLTVGANGRQFRFDQLPYEDGKGRIKGMADGVIVGAPSIVATPCLWENKEVNSKNWNKLKKHGVKATKPEYYVQTQLLMGYLGLADNPALFTAKCADTQAIYAERIAFDAPAAQQASDRGIKIVQSQSPEDFPRIATDSSNFKCKFCDFHDRCWASPAPAASAMPAWLANPVQAS